MRTLTLQESLWQEFADEIGGVYEEARLFGAGDFGAERIEVATGVGRVTLIAAGQAPPTRARLFVDLAAPGALRFALVHEAIFPLNAAESGLSEVGCAPVGYAPELVLATNNVPQATALLSSATLQRNAGCIPRFALSLLSLSARDARLMLRVADPLTTREALLAALLLVTETAERLPRL